MEPKRPLLARARGGIDQSTATGKRHHCGYVGDGRLTSGRGGIFPDSHRITPVRGSDYTTILAEDGGVIHSLQCGQCPPGRSRLGNQEKEESEVRYQRRPPHSSSKPLQDGLNSAFNKKDRIPNKTRISISPCQRSRKDPER